MYIRFETFDGVGLFHAALEFQRVVAARRRYVRGRHRHQIETLIHWLSN